MPTGIAPRRPVDPTRDPSRAGSDDGTEPSASVRFEDQTSNGTVVTVDEVNTSDGGFVTIHDASLLEGEVFGSVVGVSGYLEPREHENVSTELYEVRGAEFDRTELEEDQLLIAMPHRDTNDDRTYDFVAVSGEADGPYTDENGEAVVDAANVTVEADHGTDNETTVGDGTVDENETVDGNETVDDNDTVDGNETVDDNETTDSAGTETNSSASVGLAR